MTRHQIVLSHGAFFSFQDIVFKLVPHLAEAEEERRKHFYRSRGLDDDQVSDQKQSLAVTEILRSNG